MNKEKSERNPQKIMGKICLIIFTAHVLFVVGLVLSGNWSLVFGETPIPKVVTWIMFNDVVAAIFGVLFGGECFERGLRITGLTVITMMLFAISLPFMFIVIPGAKIVRSFTWRTATQDAKNKADRLDR